MFAIEAYDEAWRGTNDGVKAGFFKNRPRTCHRGKIVRAIRASRGLIPPAHEKLFNAVGFETTQGAAIV
jgi:hypothetical protein